MRLCVLDFETANNSLASACSIGVVVFEDGVLVEEFHQLIQPHPAYDRFDLRNIEIHKIHPEMVKDAPSFAMIYPKLLDLFENAILMAHNARFDVSVLEACIHAYGLKRQSLSYIDSLEIARKAYPQLINHKLNTVCEHLNYTLDHHNALSDAYGSAMILLDVMSLLEEYDLMEVIKKLNLRLNHL